MLPQLSPGVVVNEIENVPSLISTIGEGINAAIVGDFAWGPVDFPVYINNIKRLTEVFGTPSPDSWTQQQAWFSVHNYLSYDAGGIWVVRSTNDNLAENSTNAVPMKDISAQIADGEYQDSLQSLIANDDTEVGDNVIKFSASDKRALQSNIHESMEIYKSVEGNVLLNTDVSGLQWNNDENKSYFSIDHAQVKNAGGKRTNNPEDYKLSTTSNKIVIGKTEYTATSLNCGQITQKIITNSVQDKFDAFVESKDGIAFLYNNNELIPKEQITSHFSGDKFNEYTIRITSENLQHIKLPIKEQLENIINSPLKEPYGKLTTSHGYVDGILNHQLTPINDTLSKLLKSSTYLSDSTADGSTTDANVLCSLVDFKKYLSKFETSGTPIVDVMEKFVSAINKTTKTVYKKSIIDSFGLAVTNSEEYVDDVQIVEPFDENSYLDGIPNITPKISDYIQATTATYTSNIGDITTKLSSYESVIDPLLKNIKQFNGSLNTLKLDWDTLPNYGIKLSTIYHSITDTNEIPNDLQKDKIIREKFPGKSLGLDTYNDDILPFIEKQQSNSLKLLYKKIQSFASSVEYIDENVNDPTKATTYGKIKAAADGMFSWVDGYNAESSEKINDFNDCVTKKAGTWSLIEAKKDDFNGIRSFYASLNKFDTIFVNNVSSDYKALTDSYYADYIDTIIDINTDEETFNKKLARLNFISESGKPANLTIDITEGSDSNIKTIIGEVESRINWYTKVTSKLDNYIKIAENYKGIYEDTKTKYATVSIKESIINSLTNFIGKKGEYDLSNFEFKANDELTLLQNKNDEENIHGFIIGTTRTVERIANASKNLPIEYLVKRIQSSDKKNPFKVDEGFEYDRGAVTQTPLNVNSPVTFSVYLKTPNTNKVKYAALRLTAGSKTDTTVFNLVTGTVENTSDSVSALDRGIKVIPDQNVTGTVGKWYRCWLTSTFDVSENNKRGDITVSIHVVNEADKDNPEKADFKFTPETSGYELYMAALQLEQSNSPTSYKPHTDDQKFVFVGKVESKNITNYTVTIDRDLNNPDEEIFKSDKIYFIDPYKSQTETVLIKNSTDFDIEAPEKHYFAAKYPGILGNSLKVAVCSSKKAFANFKDPDYGIDYRNYFENKAPGTTPYVRTALKGYNDDLNDEIYILVLDHYGLITGKKNGKLESFKCSKLIDAEDEYGNNKYYVNYINANSKYIYALKPMNKNWGVTIESMKYQAPFDENQGVYIKEFVNGDTKYPKKDNIINSWKTLKNKDYYPFDLVITGGSTITNDNNTIINDINDTIVKNRKNCIMTVSPPLDIISGDAATIAGKVKDYFASDTGLGIDSTYVIADSGWKYQYNPYSKKYFWIPLNPDIAGLVARTAKTKGPWHSPAGYVRGKLNHVVKLRWNPDQDERDIIYPEGINPVITENSGAGTILFGDRTRTNVDVSTGKINVRMLFITLENKISAYAKQKLFELNDAYTRNTFTFNVDSYLKSVKSDRGLTDYKIVCDESNNTPDVINSSGFVGDIYIAPPMSINYIQLNFINTPSGISFTVIE